MHSMKPTINAEELKVLIEDKKNFFIVDVLPKVYYDEKHIKGAINACVYEMTFLEQIKKHKLEKKDKIILYGASDRSKDSEVAAGKLGAIGYHNVQYLVGGIETWEKEGYDTETDESKTVQEQFIENGPYKLNSKQSRLQWSGRNFGTKHIGTVPFKADLEFAGEIISGEFIIDMTKIHNEDIKDKKMSNLLETHLKSDDFFEVEKYPTAKFKINESIHLDKDAVDNFKLRGDLTIKDHTHPIEITASIGPHSEGGVMLQTHFDIDRTKWGVEYGSMKLFEKLSYHIVSNIISFDITAHLVKAD